MKKKPEKKPLPQDIPITPYYADIPFTRLLMGVDNLRYDVFLSPGFSQAASDFAFQLILKHSDASEPLQTKQKINWFLETDRFKTACTEVMTDAINQAKSASEVQIDYLAQAALVKKLIAETENQYDAAIRHFKSVIRRHEVDYRTGTHLRLREEVFTIIQKRSRIIQQAGAELFDYFLEARQELNELRAINFGVDALLAEELFSNPLLNAPYRPDDFFMISNYVLTGYRLEDPLNYSNLISLLRKFFTETGIGGQTEPDRIIKNPENMDLLFNFFDTRSLLYKEKKKREPDTGRVKDLAARTQAQKKMLQVIYRQFKREKMPECIVAAYEVPGITRQYCPPLSPQELLQYMVVPRARKNIVRKVKRFKKYTGKKISLARLKKAKRFVRVSGEQKKKRLVRFLKDFAAYHRDLENYHLFNEKADCINLAEDDRTVRLSRENNTLYEFLFPKEHETGKQEIAGHVVVKADVRGSTEIIDRMKARGLNPASTFSLNFFDPINRLLPRYGAHKIFIEGDAVILSIFEYTTTPARSYSVARACGLSVQMALLVRQYNRWNVKKGLPSLDLGIGISYSKGSPTFFYDQDTRIMISHSINEADKLSECHRALRKRMEHANSLFNVHLFQIDTSDEARNLTIETPILRYNVMGIELAPRAFKKLAREIHLKRIKGPVPELEVDHFAGYTGKFPTQYGNFQRLVIREAQIPEVSPENFRTNRMTRKKYYEVCTHPGLYEHIKHL